jgi:hypothetical protein
VEVLLSPLLILEVVIRALLESGMALLVPVAGLGVFAGWVFWKWAPKAETSPVSSSPSTGFLAGWVPRELVVAPTDSHQWSTVAGEEPR